jgi:NAD(P)-dependent dehydrogenase (short-subunit alcohol dehydrogenase family)
MNLDLRGKKAVVTGGAGAICGAIAVALAQEGVDVAIWDIAMGKARSKERELSRLGIRCIAIECDVTDGGAVSASTQRTVEEFGTVDILINGVGASRKATTTDADRSFFDITVQAMHDTLSLNYLSTVVTSQHVGKIFAENGKGVILNVTSIAGCTPLTRALTYSDGKHAANSFTRWFAVHMAQNYSPRIRVNAVAPGFVSTDQNRFLLYDEKTGEMTERCRRIMSNVPMGRLGSPDEIVGAALWLVSDLAGYVTGIVVPVDGGFTAYSGV